MEGVSTDVCHSPSRCWQLWSGRALVGKSPEAEIKMWCLFKIWQNLLMPTVHYLRSRYSIEAKGAKRY